jgi:hypothetical protein
MKRVLIPEDGRKPGPVTGERRGKKLRHIGSLVAAGLLAAVGASAAGPPETVHVTYHVQSGKLDEFLAVLRQHYPAGRKLGIVLAEPHLILAGKEDGGHPVVIEILTWRDADAPDNVTRKYPTVRAIWDRLNALVEKRDGKPAIDINEMEIVPREQAPRRGGKR